MRLIPFRAKPERHEAQDAELIVAVFRAVVLLVALIIAQLIGSGSQGSFSETFLAGIACIYNVAAGVACIFPSRFGLRRPFIVAMDAVLITTWIHISGLWELFPIYYMVVVVAAMWFRVFGGAVVAVFCNFFFLLMWALEAFDRTQLLSNGTGVALNSALLFMVGCLVGYIVEIQENERQRRLEDELLISNYQREIDLSSHLQPLLIDSELLDEAPDNPEGRVVVRYHEELAIGAAMHSARLLGGGDYFDLITIDSDRTGLCIADVSGKSARAQARLPLLKYSLRALAPLYDDPQSLLARLNETLEPDLQPELYIACCYIILDQRRQSLAWCNAGHIAPLHVSGAQTEVASQVTPLETDGPALGMFPDTTYGGNTLPWRPGDQLLLYTDGLTDAFSYGGNEDGEQQIRLLTPRLAAEKQKPVRQVAHEFVELADAILDGDQRPGGLLQRMKPDAQEARHRDDITVVLVRHKG